VTSRVRYLKFQKTKKNILVVDLLIKKGATANTVDMETGKTPLHEALYNKHAEVASMLVNKGNISMTVRDHEMGETAIHLAVRSIATTQDILLCSHILDKADINALNVQDKSGNTLLHIAAIRSIAPKASTALVETILAYKVDPTIKNKQNKTPLDILLASENTKLIDMVRRYTLSFMAAQSPPISAKPKEPEETGNSK
jgi:ankyrin repeat protein